MDQNVNLRMVPNSLNVTLINTCHIKLDLAMGLLENAIAHMVSVATFCTGHSPHLAKKIIYINTERSYIKQNLRMVACFCKL